MTRHQLSMGIFVAAASVLAALPARSQTFSVAYISGGNVWVLGNADGAPARLTNSGACHSPRFSADGAYIAFEENGAIHLVDVARHRAVKLGAKIAGDFMWSPWENALAASNDGSVYIFSQRDAWAGVRVFKVASPRSDVGGIVFNRDGQGLLVSLREAGTHGDVGKIEAVDLDQQSSRATLVSEPGDGLVPYGWLRDSKTLLFWVQPSFSASFEEDGLDLYEMPAAQHAVKRLVGVKTFVYNDQLELSPLGDSLLVTRTTPQVGRETYDGTSIAKVDLLSGGVQVVSSPGTSALFPVWSPSGDEIAYAQAPVGWEHMKERRIWLESPDGAGKRQLTPESNYRDEKPVWLSKDTIMFSRIDSSYHASLWTISKDGSDLRKLADLPTLPDEAFGNYGYIDWSDYFGVWIRHGL